MSIRKKIGALVVAFLLFDLATAFGYRLVVNRVRDLALENSTNLMMQDYRNELKDVVDAMALSLSSAVEGVTDEAEVYRIFSRLSKPARFFSDRSGYFFIYKLGGTVFVHATLPALEGKNIIDRKDPKGRDYIRQLDQASQAGGGYVDFYFDKPGVGVVPKLGYARMIPKTQYWIGTGVYIDDVDVRKELLSSKIQDLTSQQVSTLSFALGGAFLLVLIPMVVFLTMTIIRPLRRLTDVANEYSAGRLELKVPGTQRNDEIGILASALARLGVSIRAAMERLNNVRKE
jgi:methyl-accepting chemotaxis protein